MCAHARPQVTTPTTSTSRSRAPGPDARPHAPVRHRARGRGGPAGGVVIATWTPHHARCQPGTPGTSRHSTQNGPRGSRLEDEPGCSGRQPHMPLSPPAEPPPHPLLPRKATGGPLPAGHCPPPCCLLHALSPLPGWGRQRDRKSAWVGEWGRPHPHSDPETSGGGGRGQQGQAWRGGTVALCAWAQPTWSPSEPRTQSKGTFTVTPQRGN